MRRLTITIALLSSFATPSDAQQRDVAVERARRYEPLIVAASIKHRVDLRLLWTVAWLESRFQPRVTSGAGGRDDVVYVRNCAALRPA